MGASHTRLTVGRSAELFALCALAIGCTDAEPTRQQSFGATLMDSLRFRAGEMIQGSLPRPTASGIALLARGPTVAILPSARELLPLEVHDPDQRQVVATLIQFEDATAYVRVPLDQAGRVTLIENEINATDDLCAGLCNAIFSVTLTEAVEFEDGRVSATTTRRVVIDCRGSGEASACDPDLDADAVAAEALCGDATAGEPVWTSDPELNAYFEAVRLLRLSRDAVGARLTAARSAMAAAFEVEGASSSAAVQDALSAEIAQQTHSGIEGLIGDRGCAARLEQAAHVLSRCDDGVPAPPPSWQCTGVCEPRDDASACAPATSAGCRGLLDGEGCGGSCTGACQFELAMPAACAGTCIGSCDADCPGGAEDCNGPCSGSCTGACRVPSAGDACAGECTGLCDDGALGGIPTCGAPLVPYCSTGDMSALACPGDCFGAPQLDAGSLVCRASALAAARAFPRCEPALVQLSFGFRPAVAPAAQARFAAAVDALNAPLVALFELRARLDLLATAAAELLASLDDELAPRLEERLAGEPGGFGLACAETELPRIRSWLEEQPAVFSQLRDEVLLLLLVSQPITE
jgi:hypothetical protein